MPSIYFLKEWILQLDTSVAIQLIILLILLILSGFFSSAETALTTVNRMRIRGLADEGNKKAKTVMHITDDTSKMLSAILIGNNVVNLSAASLTTTLAYNLGGSMVAVASAVLSVLIIIFGEITPKTMATLHAEKMSLRYAPVINLYIKVMTPFVFIINKLSDIILRVLHIDPNAKNNQMTESELRTIVDVSHESGVIESDEKEMIYNVFDLGDAKAKDVMVPRVHVTFADVNATYEELIDIFRKDKFTRLPIFEDTTDNVIGTINMKDLLLYDKEKEFHIRDFMREAYFTYEYKNISELLVEMRQASFNIAIVLDEYGETSGLITLEDILEEIVGEIHDEYDENEEDFIKQIGEREYIVEGSTNLDDLNDRLDLDLTSEEYDSVGGFIIEHLDRLPEIGDGVTTEDGIHLVVEKLDKNRIESVHLYLPEPKPEDEEGDEDYPRLLFHISIFFVFYLFSGKFQNIFDLILTDSETFCHFVYTDFPSVLFFHTLNCFIKFCHFFNHLMISSFHLCLRLQGSHHSGTHLLQNLFFVFFLRNLFQCDHQCYISLLDHVTDKHFRMMQSDRFFHYFRQIISHTYFFLCLFFHIPESAQIFFHVFLFFCT